MVFFKDLRIGTEAIFALIRDFKALDCDHTLPPWSQVKEFMKVVSQELWIKIYLPGRRSQSSSLQN